MKRLLLAFLFLVVAGCSSNAIRVSGEAVNIKVPMSHQSHVVTDGQCQHCLRELSEHLADCVNSGDRQIAEYQTFAEGNTGRLVEKFSSRGTSPAKAE